MKNIFRVIGFGLAVVVFSAVNGFAQNPCDDTYEVKTDAIKKFKENIASPLTVAKLKVALQVGNDFNARYKGCEDTAPAVEYLNKKLPAVQQEHDRLDRLDRFNKSVPAKNWTEAFTAGKQIIAAEPDTPLSLDVALILASIGFDRVILDKVDTYNNDAIAMAELAIKKIEAGKTSDNFGGLGIAYKNAKFADGKSNALGWMNYTIGYIKYARQEKKKEALPFLYTAATKYNSATKNFPEIYRLIGVWYLEELLAIDKSRLEKIEANAKKDNEETLAMWAMEKGYAERSIDAYARAYKLASASTKTQAETDYKNSIYTKLQELYKLRFDKTDGLDAYVATISSKPMPDPLTAVTPVKEEVPVTTTTTTSTTNTTNTTTKPTSTTDTTTKPTSTTTTTNTTTKPTSTTTKPNSSTTKPKTTKPKTTKKKTTR